MARRTVFAESKDVGLHLRLIDKNASKGLSPRSELLMPRLAISEDNNGRLLRHFDDVLVVVRPNGIGKFN